ncbi:hypothetical protein BEN47_09620 [Hymenobacter lapidarius]|uniref:Uncharacterized protein n=1 Tax=Hymenobacter lapidarius TaxID=1908237 RepID=A0A1G1TB69_9BACT|nr:hypothetical protein [Hymenobacter lapidarius]OGX88118.1 hypothetical protein BEN47_09620 [Hymenobacter lapidarius]
MNKNRFASQLLCLVSVGTTCFAQAQNTTTTADRPTTSLGVYSLPGTPSESARYAVAHDSLTRLVNTAYANAETLMTSFSEAQSSFGSIHRRIKSFSDTQLKQLVKREVVKQRFGIELRKVVYYDPKGRKFLTERYENHQLIRLALKQHQEPYNAPAATWVFVRGNYLKRTSNRAFNSGKGRKTSYFFNPLPATK